MQLPYLSWSVMDNDVHSFKHPSWVLNDLKVVENSLRFITDYVSRCYGLIKKTCLCGTSGMVIAKLCRIVTHIIFWRPYYGNICNEGGR